MVAIAVPLEGELPLSGPVQGHLPMDVKISETTTGVKSFFLKLGDPFFRDKGRTSIPIKIGGTVKKPDFRLAVGRAKHVDEPSNK